MTENFGPYKHTPIANLGRERYVARKRKGRFVTWVIIPAIAFGVFLFVTRNQSDVTRLIQSAASSVSKQLGSAPSRPPSCVVVPRMTNIFPDATTNNMFGPVARDETLLVLGESGNRYQVQRSSGNNPSNQPTFVEKTQVKPC